MPNAPQTSEAVLQEVTTRNEYARAIIEGFSSALPNLADFWDQIRTALADTTTLITALRLIRLDHANLAAAARASINADHDGESDPLSYLRDELSAQGFWGRS